MRGSAERQVEAREGGRSTERGSRAEETRGGVARPPPSACHAGRLRQAAGVAGKAQRAASRPHRRPRVCQASKVHLRRHLAGQVSGGAVGAIDLRVKWADGSGGGCGARQGVKAAAAPAAATAQAAAAAAAVQGGGGGAAALWPHSHSRLTLPPHTPRSGQPPPATGRGGGRAGGCQVRRGGTAGAAAALPKAQARASSLQPSRKHPPAARPQPPTPSFNALHPARNASQAKHPPAARPPTPAGAACPAPIQPHRAAPNTQAPKHPPPARPQTPPGWPPAARPRPGGGTLHTPAAGAAAWGGGAGGSRGGWRRACGVWTAGVAGGAGLQPPAYGRFPTATAQARPAHGNPASTAAPCSCR